MHGLLLGRDPIHIIVNDYVRTIQPLVMSELVAYATYTPRIDACVRGLHRCKMSYIPGNTHQSSISKLSKTAAFNALNSTYPPSGINNFEDLFDWVYTVLKSKGIVKQPCLWVYDIAMRIGQGLPTKIEPKKYVYLYRGAYNGAIMLGSISPIRNHRAPLSAFPPILCKMGALHIENILCDYSK